MFRRACRSTDKKGSAIPYHNGYFDDLVVEVTQPNILHATDYYPFGLAIRERSLEREKYRFQYQGQFAEYDEETGRNDFELRSWDSMLGRWLVPDPYRQYWSSYVGMGNNPTNLVDPDGGCADVNGNVVPCPDGAQDGLDGFHTTVLDGFEFNGGGVLGDESLAIPKNQSGVAINTTPNLDFQAAQDQAVYEAAVVISFAKELFESQFKASNHSDDGNVSASSPPIPGGNLGKVYKQLKAARLAKKLVNSGRAPKNIKRIDIPKLDPNGVPLHGQKPHIHFKNGALNIDGTWKHMPKNEAKMLTNEIKGWLKNNGWELPK